MRLTSILVCLAALALAGCNTTTSGTVSSFGGKTAKPRTIVVTDFAFASEVVTLDRGFTARLSRKIGEIPPHERKQRTIERVNDEIVATIVATLRAGGLEAKPGSEETLSLSDTALVVSGRLRAGDDSAKRDAIGFGPGRSGVVADMTVASFSGSGRKTVLTFAAETPSGRRPAARGGTANNAAIAAVTAEGGTAEKLSADVEAQARTLGREAGEKILAYAKEQGWLDKPAGEGEAAPSS